MTTFKIPTTKLNQRDMLAKYGKFLKITRADISLNTNINIETIRQVYIGISHNKPVLEFLRERFKEVEEFEGKLPLDLAAMFRKSLAVKDRKSIK